MIVVVGERIGEMKKKGYEIVKIKVKKKKIVNINKGEEEMGRVYNEDVKINEGMNELCDEDEKIEKVEDKRWKEWEERENEEYRENIK